MHWSWFLIKFWSICLSVATAADDCDSDVHQAHAGHLQPFGSSGPFHEVEVTQSFPSTVEFFKQYVLPLRPLKMTGAARLSCAFHRWTDDYFLQTAVSVNSCVAVETSKKENRSNPLQYLHFHEFLRVYNTTDQYMVDNIPPEFRYMFFSVPLFVVFFLCQFFFMRFCSSKVISRVISGVWLINMELLLEDVPSVI